jgi:hypothetical protein
LDVDFAGGAIGVIKEYIRDERSSSCSDDKETLENDLIQDFDILESAPEEPAQVHVHKLY